MNLPIKFRGQMLNADKDYVYGDLIQEPFGLPVIRVFDYEECEKGFYAADDYEVYPDSVARLIGYDADGNEVYSDDALSDGNAKCYPKIFIELESEDGSTDTTIWATGLSVGNLRRVKTMKKCQMIMALPNELNAELVVEMITALAHFRYDGKYGREYAEEIPVWSMGIYRNGKNYYEIEAEFVTVELIDVIEDIKKLLPVEIYFEAGEPDDSDSRGEIYDNAVYSLYIEKFHDCRKSA